MEEGVVGEDMVGRCVKGFETVVEESLETESSGEKWMGNNTEAGIDPTWDIMPMLIIISENLFADHH